MQTVSLSLFRYRSVLSRLWALWMMGEARWFLSRHPDLQFWKLCGSGTGEGFTPVPNTGIYAILAVWPDADTARRHVTTSRLWARYRRRATEHWTLFLDPIESRGRWSGEVPFSPRRDDGAGPVAALTRATLRPSRAARFWRQQPDVSRLIGANRDVLFKIGIGEVPLLQQITFSVWPDTDAMARFARASGPHAAAIAAVREGGWFREELYARFRISGETGSWDGQSPRIPMESSA
ncbi:Spheroidene monooxygenase [Roseivivax jejudonensis]|uniref:Spheroidene monooxygenase n=1 Tax=Roseivivax jejudonensis TaxID=1529041 RepID=A0A1X6ZNA0_9RHOB|nr:spheroidene monooxygenase [Roseivivax jejudonensis]SLN56587.1 Spheroidene monooxygenase [Roseivivax jejudonensis]